MIALTYSCGHTGTIAAPNDGGGACHAPKPCPDCWAPPTVKQSDLFGNIHDTRQTESELNGWTIDGAPAERQDRRRVCICGHGFQFHRRHFGLCERCSHRRASHMFQQVNTEPLFPMPGEML